MAQFFDFDPLTGVKELFTYDHEKDRALIRSVQDVEPLLDRNKATANEGTADAGIKKGIWHYASIPVTQQLEMKKQGINPYPRTKEEWKALFSFVNARPYLKTTHKHHS